MSDHGHNDHGGLGKYFAVAVMLCMLTTASFLTYFPFWHDTFSKPTSWTFMLAVAVTKASLVMMFFMHLKWEAAWKYVLTIPSIIMAMFLMLALVPDVGMRISRESEERAARAAVITHMDSDDDDYEEEAGSHH